MAAFHAEPQVSPALSRASPTSATAQIRYPFKNGLATSQMEPAPQATIHNADPAEAAIRIPVQKSAPAQRLQSTVRPSTSPKKSIVPSSSRPVEAECERAVKGGPPKDSAKANPHYAAMNSAHGARSEALNSVRKGFDLLVIREHPRPMSNNEVAGPWPIWLSRRPDHGRGAFRVTAARHRG